MWNLKALAAFDARGHLNTAFANGEVTEVEKDYLMGLYQQYQANLGRPSAAMDGAGQRPELYNLVHDAYGLVQDNRRLKKLRADLKLLADYCPYCGFAPISDLDHHLQRGRYKLLSIFALNLVPCCHPCNSGKRRVPSDNPAEHQLHTYLESVAQFDFLRAAAALHPETGALGVSYTIEHCEGMSAELHHRLVNHLAEFDLHTKYAKQVNIHLSEQLFALTMAFEGGAYVLRNYLNGTAEAHKGNFGVNDWRTALFRGLAECDAFCNGGFKRALGKKIVNVEAVPQQAAVA
ncbi:MAG: hypothetical protein JST61_01235 [Acidobacteria bacterium]|nr:hypothetical protein [Acidobacteriota bacterium]